MIVINEISRAFNQHALEYEHAAKVQEEIGQRLFKRLDYMKISPQRILDLGCGTGKLSQQLSIKYPKAQIIGLDLAYDMLVQAKAKQNWRRKWSLLAADMGTMPFADGIFDLIFANQVIHWSHSIKLVFRELNRVLKVNGCLMFSTLGPDTFKELKTAWSLVNSHAHVNEFTDMHDIGDCLLAENFLEPVVDMEILAIHYGSLSQLIDALRRQGVKNINPQRNKGLTSKRDWASFEKNYQAFKTKSGKFPLSYEVIYGQAWKAQHRQITKGIETYVPISQIKTL